MKRVFFVIGPESSGTRLATRLFMSAGCAGDDTHTQRLDRFVETGQGLVGEFEEANSIVFRRSVPHGGRSDMPDIRAIVESFGNHGFSCLMIVCVRDWYTLARSKIRNGFAPNRAAGYSAAKDEMAHIFESINSGMLDYFLFNTSVLFEDPDRAIKGLAEFTGLEFPDGLVNTIFNADAQYD